MEQYIRQNVVWTRLPEEIQIVLGNSQREYDKLVLEYSIKNQLRYKGNIGGIASYLKFNHLGCCLVLSENGFCLLYL